MNSRIMGTGIQYPERTVDEHSEGTKVTSSGRSRAAHMCWPAREVEALHNIADDPGETRDLADTYPETLKELRAARDRNAEAAGVAPAER